MKRKNATLLGNVLMGLGLVGMVGGIAFTILNQLPNFGFPDYVAHSAIMGIFCGALIWLVGASISGRERVHDHYWWVRRYDVRCRKNHRHS